MAIMELVFKNTGAGNRRALTPLIHEQHNYRRRNLSFFLRGPRRCFKYTTPTTSLPSVVIHLVPCIKQILCSQAMHTSDRRSERPQSKVKPPRGFAVAGQGAIMRLRRGSMQTAGTSQRRLNSKWHLTPENPPIVLGRIQAIMDSLSPNRLA